MTILFVINPHSGGSSHNEWESLINDFFDPYNFQCLFYYLEDRDEEASIKHLIEKFKPATIVAVGGDGTVSIVAKVVLTTNISLGIIPAGSANGMAKELNIPENPAAAMKIIASGHTRNADVIEINAQHICLHLSDIGLNARLIKHFEEGRLRGKLGYATKVLKTLWKKSNMKVTVRIGREESTHIALMVVLANATKYGTGAVINPEGNLYDGQFEVVVMRKLSVSELLKMWFNPRPFNPKKIKIYKATSVTVETKRAVHFQVDGEYLGKTRYVNAHILPAQLKLLVPS